MWHTALQATYSALGAVPKRFRLYVQVRAEALKYSDLPQGPHKLESKLGILKTGTCS